ncbi:hypothetical protein [Stieleria varia]|uniref:hypothetical protein n=1 Tax=Stieleria varia TaxID=2528005 RepID=UPI001E526F3C|nr:hypothetical protein [Stieleria varia]
MFATYTAIGDGNLAIGGSTDNDLRTVDRNALATLFTVESEELKSNQGLDAVREEEEMQLHVELLTSRIVGQADEDLTSI